MEYFYEDMKICVLQDLNVFKTARQEGFRTHAQDGFR